jgi:hypothetical protein
MIVSALKRQRIRVICNMPDLLWEHPNFKAFNKPLKVLKTRVLNTIEKAYFRGKLTSYAKRDARDLNNC